MGRFAVSRIKRTVVAAILAGAVSVPASVATAQDHGRRARHEDRRDDHRGRNDRRDDDRREWRNYDYDRYEPGQRRYDASRYYRRDAGYSERRLTRNDRIYRGYDDQYYCRHSDGTTGLIIGGIGGGVLGNVIAPGGSKTLGTILGAGGGALLGRAIDQKRVICR